MPVARTFISTDEPLSGLLQSVHVGKAHLAPYCWLTISPVRYWCDLTDLLLGANKAGARDSWYAEAVPRSDALYDEYVQELRAEGKLP